MENQKEQTWVLESIRIDLLTYGNDKGKYRGSIKFTNNDGDDFTFRLNPTLANAYLELIKDTIVLSANDLAEKLQQSLNQNKQNTNTSFTPHNANAVAEYNEGLKNFTPNN